MKKIGFIDYYISEWHANNYPKWIKEASERLGLQYKVEYAYAEKYISPVDNRNTDEWCEAFSVKKCDSIAELCEKSDFVIVLAPSNPEKHLGYAKEVLKHGKPTYIDKTFAQNYETAEKIFKIGEELGTEFFSSSALRYSSALDGLTDVKYITTFGGGSNLPEYIIHQAEMVISACRARPLSVKVEKQGCQYISLVKLDGEKAATMIYSPDLSFAVSAENSFGKRVYKPAASDHFPRLLESILIFFETRTRSFDAKETLEVMKLRDAVLCGKDKLGEEIKITV